MAGGSDLKPSAEALILTLEIDGETFGRLDALRRRFYPPERNRVPAHVTLFYRLPPERKREIAAFLRDIAAGQKPLDIALSAPKPMERGVALFLVSPQLHALRERLAAEWWPWLGEEDRRAFRPHVTLAHGVSDAEARRTEREIAPLSPPRLRGLGLHLWRYRNDGAWQDLQLHRFR
jgi:2'-5' RNA ligase